MTKEIKVKNLAVLEQEQFDVLLHISALLNAAIYHDNLVADSLDLIIRALQAERGLFARREKANSFNIIAARNIDKQDISDLSVFSSGILNRVMDTQKPCLYHDVPSDPTVSQFQSIQIHNIKSVIGVPIFLHGDIWGVILIDSRGNRAGFTQENLTFLEFFSNMVSLALDKIIAMESLSDENQILRNQLEMHRAIPDMVGDCPAMQRVADLIFRVAKTDATVLLLGESGTGKDLAAQAIHKLSGRKDKPYIAQFCGSIPDTLLESELFGYKKGAFSGAAADKKGLFEVASGGTFFLDEIGDVSAATQSKLLRVLQNQEIIRLGDTQVKTVDVRIIAATNHNLRQLVAERRFREDLYYRLNVFPITLPPLRERRSDIILLAQHFVKKQNRKITIPPATMNKLMDFDWPGNVRQLENVLQRALILCDSATLTPDYIFLEEDSKGRCFHGTLKDIEKEVLLSRLKEFDNNRTRAAHSLGVSVRWVQLKLKEIESQD
ncbi:sigma 54-interacting transcriptional regulator [candidate division KSB1 bacterium]|nr:sigma 54-interacting transcriptional regulator [candidate division KSB1 bacterium]RQW07463.1 MAG: GAF domain-containing protein [candidate division KSB1 bacterium]